MASPAQVPLLIGGEITWVIAAVLPAAGVCPAAPAPPTPRPPAQAAAAALRAGVAARVAAAAPAPAGSGVLAAVRGAGARASSAAASCVSCARAWPRASLACAAAAGVWLVGVLVAWQAAQLLVIALGFVVIATTMTAGARAPGSLSAFSVFNPNFARLPGTLTADDFDAEIRGGAGAQRFGGRERGADADAARDEDARAPPLDAAARRLHAERMRRAALRRAGGEDGDDGGGGGGGGGDDDEEDEEEQRQLQEALRRSLQER